MGKNTALFSHLNGKNLKIAVVFSRWNDEVVNGLRAGCDRAFLECGVAKKQIVFENVPGCFELPYAIKKIILRKKIDVVIALGCLIKGETQHDEYIAQATSQGLMAVALDTKVPVIFGILTCANEKQALVRSSGENNHGYFWGKTAVEMGLLKNKK